MRPVRLVKTAFLTLISLPPFSTSAPIQGSVRPYLTHIQEVFLHA